MNIKTLALLVLMSGCSAANAAVDWNSLSPAQQSVLAPMQANWATLPSARQEKLAVGAARWSAMTPQQRAEAQQRLAFWKTLSPQEQAATLAKRDEYRKMSPDQRLKLQQAQQGFKSLPLSEQQMLRERFEQLQIQQPNSLNAPAVPNAANPGLPPLSATPPAGIALPLVH